MRKFFIAVLLALSAVCNLHAADIPVVPTGGVFKLTPSPTWGISGPTGFNNNFFFTPIALNESVCVYVKNNNTTSSHTFTASLTVTSDPNNSSPSDGTWQNTASSSLLFTSASPSVAAGIGGSVSGVSQVSINFSASTTQAGSPETANVVIIQTPGNCFSGNQFIGSAAQSVNAVPAIQTISDGLSQAFLIDSQLVTNPILSQTILQVNNNSGSRTVYLDRILVNCSASCTVSINITSNAGSGCTVAPIVNQKPNSSITSIASATQSSCATTNPTVFNSIFPFFTIGAATVVSIDLRGIIIPSGSTQGVEINMGAALTGTITTAMFWYEK